MHSINIWFHLTTFQILLLGMMLMMTVFSFIHYLAFRIHASGLRLLFNLGVIAGVLVAGTFQAGIWNSYTYYLATNVITLGSAILYMLLICLGLDMRLYDPKVADRVLRFIHYFPWIGLTSLAVDLAANAYTMSILIILLCLGFILAMVRLWYKNKRLPFYIHLFMWGAVVLLLAAAATFSLKFVEVRLHIDNQTLVHSLLLPALSLEFIAFAAGDMLKLHHAVLMRDRLLSELKQVRGAQREQESISLAYRLNTHTLANVLNRIQHALVKHDATVAMNLVHDYSAYLRSALQLKESGSHSLHEEVELLRRYLELNKVQMGPDFSYRIIQKADPNIPLPCMICLPGVENAIIHGFGDGLTQNPQVDIVFWQEGRLLLVEICDNGRGLPENMKQDQRFGLQNTRKRLALLSEKTGIESAYRLENRNETSENSTGVCLTLGIPILTAETPNYQHKKTNT